MDKQGFISRVHRKKPKGRPMPEVTRRANNIKSKVRSRVEHVFAEQKSRMGLFIRTIGIARATTKIGLANLAYNMKRLIYLDRIAITRPTAERADYCAAQAKKSPPDDLIPAPKWLAITQSRR